MGTAIHFGLIPRDYTMHVNNWKIQEPKTSALSNPSILFFYPFCGNIEELYVLLAYTRCTECKVHFGVYWINMVIVKKRFQLHPIRWSKEAFHSFQQLYHIPFGWDVRRNIDDNVNNYIFLSNKMHHICNIYIWITDNNLIFTFF